HAASAFFPPQSLTHQPSFGRTCLCGRVILCLSAVAFPDGVCGFSGLLDQCQRTDFHWTGVDYQSADHATDYLCHIPARRLDAGFTITNLSYRTVLQLAADGTERHMATIAAGLIHGTHHHVGGWLLCHSLCLAPAHHPQLE